MHKTMLTLIFSLVVIYVAAQVNNTITIKKNFGGQTFYQNGVLLKSKQLKTILKTDAEAYKVYQSSRAATTVGTILGYTGGFMMGWSLGTAIGGGKPNWAIGGIGAGLAAVSIPFSISANKKIKKSVETYNQSGKNTRLHPGQMRMEIRPERISLVYSL